MQPRYGPVIALCSLLCALALGLAFGVANLDPPDAPEVAAVDDGIGTADISAIEAGDFDAPAYRDDGVPARIEPDDGIEAEPQAVAYRDDGLILWRNPMLDEPDPAPNLGLRSHGIDVTDYSSHTLRDAGGRFAGADC